MLNLNHLFKLQPTRDTTFLSLSSLPFHLYTLNFTCNTSTTRSFFHSSTLSLGISLLLLYWYGQASFWDSCTGGFFFLVGRTKETVSVKNFTKLQMVIYDRKQAASGMEFYIWVSFFLLASEGYLFTPLTIRFLGMISQSRLVSDGDPSRIALSSSHTKHQPDDRCHAQDPGFTHSTNSQLLLLLNVMKPSKQPVLLSIAFFNILYIYASFCC